MAAIAVVAAGLVIVMARMGGSGDGGGADGVSEGIPEELVGGIAPGTVPEAVGAAMDRPIVAARVVDDVDAEVLDMCESFGEGFDHSTVEVVSALATPDVLQVTLRGDSMMGEEFGVESTDGGPVPFQMRCNARFADGGWITDGGGLEPVDTGVPRGGGVHGMSCCDEQGRSTATAVVDPPPEASWVLQDRGEWLLAYPVVDRQPVTISWRFREAGPEGRTPPVRVTHMSDSGEILSEELVGGEF